MVVIGVTGKKLSGKDEVYIALRQCHAGVARVAFADPLKRELALACGVDREFIERHKAQFRLGLQWWGTEFRRGFYGEDYWLCRADQRMAELDSQSAPIVVVTDVRFPDEAEFLRKRWRGVIWRVVRPQPWWRRVLDLFTWEHASERYAHQIPADEIVLNNATLGRLHQKVRGLARSHGIGGLPAVKI